MSSCNVVKRPVAPRFTFFVPWTRYEFVEKMLDNINGLYLPRQDLEVVFYIDTDDKRLYQRLFSWALLNQFVYNGISLIVSGNTAPITHYPTPRRDRIVAMKEDSKQYISDTELVFAVEDDTKIPVDAFETLFDDINQNDVGFVQGVQQGRWGINVLGAWQVDNLNNPQLMRTLPFEHKTDIVEVDGGGFFCYMTPTDLYKKHKYYWHDECFGPDSTYGIELRKQGYKCLMDFRLICDHYTQQGIMVPTPVNTTTAEWKKEGDEWVKTIC